MTVQSLYYLYGISVGNTFIPQITNWSVNKGVTELVESGSGAVDPTFVAIGEMRPAISITTSAIATSLGACGMDGLAISSGVPVVAYMQKAAAGSTRMSGSNHIKLTMNKGIMIPRQISATHNQIATINYDIFALYDGTNAPIIYANNQALTGSTAASELFTCGPIYAGATLINSIQSTTVDFGIRERIHSGSGEVYPTFGCIESRRPSITANTDDVVSDIALGFGGRAESATASKVYLRKIAKGSDRVADSTGEHILFTLAEGRHHIESLSGNVDSPLAGGLRFTPSGASNIIAVNLAATIGA